MKSEVFQFRTTAEDKKLMNETKERGGWYSVSEMIRSLVKEAADKQEAKQ